MIRRHESNLLNVSFENMNLPNSVSIYDCTLRDGEQTPGVTLQASDKLKIAKQLEKLGVDVKEAGFPVNSGNEKEAVTLISKEVSNCEVAALARIIKKDINECLDCDVDIIHVFVPTSQVQLKYQIGKEPEEIINSTIEAVNYVKDHGVKCVFSAMDATRSNINYLLEIYRNVEAAGADVINIADTVGVMIPSSMKKFVSGITSKLKTKLSIHCHNDYGLAVANTLAAVEAGASHVQGTINGLGERCGNADLTTIIPNLALKLGYQVNVKLENLRETSQYIYKLANLHVNKYQPYVGDYAFSHKGGVHIYAVTKNPKAYEHINPSQVGNFRQIVLSNQAGKTTVLKIGEKLGFNLKKGLKTQEILKKVKELENKGYHLENADGKLWLLYAEKLGVMKKFFEVVEWKVVSLSSVRSMAWVRIKVNGKQEKEFSKGVGPVNAFDLALRKILQKHYPEMEKVKLINFKVSVINQEGTASKVEVFTEFSSGQRQWSTVGVDKNILKASEEALIDGYMFYLNRLNSKSLSKNNT